MKNEERRTCQDFRHVGTRREYFMQNPEKFQDYVRKWRGEKPVEPLDKDRAKRDKEYIGFYLCDNMKYCETCPVPLDEDGLCDGMCDEWLDSPMESDTPENDGMAGLHPDDVKAVKEILEQARKSSPYEEGYVKALRDFTNLARTDLYYPITFYDEGVNTGIRKAIDVAEYLIQKMRGR